MAGRNSDGSYDAADSGGFGKDYHGQDAFGERLGGTGVGGSHFGGKAAGDFSGADELGEGHFTERYTDYGQAMATESPTEVGDATEVASNMRDTLRGMDNTETENSNVGSMDTSFQIGDINEDLEKARKDKEAAAERLEKARKAKEADAEKLESFGKFAENMIADTEKAMEEMKSTNPLERIANTIANNFKDVPRTTIDAIERLSRSYGVDFDRAKLESDVKTNGPDAITEAMKSMFDKARSKYETWAQSSAAAYDLSKSSFTNKAAAYDKLKSSFTNKTEPAKEKKATTPSEVMKEFDLHAETLATNLEKMLGQLDSKSPFGESLKNTITTKSIAVVESIADSYGVGLDKAKFESDAWKGGADVIRQTMKDVLRKARSKLEVNAEDKPSTTDSLKSSFTDKMKPSATDAKTAKPGKNMSSAKTSPSDYITKANKDSTKETATNRNDFGNHAVDTLKGVTDRITGSVTADALGLKSIEEFARENGYNPEKLSTMKAYLSYQNKEIMKAIPGIVKQIGSYITERVKDVVDPSQLGERVRNTIARYNLATLIGAAILSMNSGAGLQASIDQALTMVDPEDQTAVSDYLEDVLSDEGAVNDLKTAFDDALAPQQNSDTNELDESIVNVGRKDNTDYSGFNAGLGTTSDKDVKVFITRNVKADPILRKMISKIGK